MMPCASHFTDAIPFPFKDVAGLAPAVHAHRPAPPRCWRLWQDRHPSPRLVPGPSKGGNDPGTQLQAPDTLVLYIGNEEPTATIEKTVVGLAQLGVYSWPIITTRPRLAGPGHGGNEACGCLNLPDDRIQPVHQM